MQFHLFAVCGALFSVIILHSSFILVRLYRPSSAPQTFPHLFGSSFPLVNKSRHFWDGGMRSIGKYRTTTKSIFGDLDISSQTFGAGSRGKCHVESEFVVHASFELQRQNNVKNEIDKNSNSCLEITRCHQGGFERNFGEILPTSLPELPVQLKDLRNN